MGLSNLLFCIPASCFVLCLSPLPWWQRRWPSCRSTWPCSGRSMWRCSRSWPTQRGAVPCLLLSPPVRELPHLQQLQTPSLAVCWTSWPTFISRNSTGEDHGWNGWVRVFFEANPAVLQMLLYSCVSALVYVVWYNPPMLLHCCSWWACHITLWKPVTVIEDREYFWYILGFSEMNVFVFAVTWKWKLQGRSSVPISLCWLLAVMSGVWPTWPPPLNWTYPVSQPWCEVTVLKE